MHELTLTLPEELYRQIQARAANKGISIEGFIVEQLAAGIAPTRNPEEEKRLLHDTLTTTGLLQPVSSELIARYVSDPSAPRCGPVQMHGKPLSVVIIEQRAGRE